MAEWFKAHAWKACLGETLSWVRIPLSPPFFTQKKIIFDLILNIEKKSKKHQKTVDLQCFFNTNSFPDFIKNFKNDIKNLS